jgi:predicted permease
VERLARLLLLLYPSSFRRRFEREWQEIASWHRERLAGARFGRTRLAAVLLMDTLRAAPTAYGDVLVSGHPYLGSVGQDLRHAVRGLRRGPLFAAAAVVSLGVGIGSNTAIFSVANAVLLQPLPYPDADRLAIVWNEFASSGQSRLPLSPVEVAELADEPGLFEDVGGVWATSVTVLDHEDRLIQVPAGRVTPSFFSVLGVEPALGRTFVADAREGRRPMGVVISHELWTGALGGDANILGRTVRVDGATVDVVGVLPEGLKLHFPPDGSIPERLDVYSSLPWDLRSLPPALHYLRVIGRLSPGMDLDRAQRGVDNAAERARATYAELAVTEDRFSIHPLQGDAVRQARPVLLALLGGVGLFLLLASANVASLVLARASVRRKEMAVRSSLGASGGRLAQLLVLESLVIGALGTALGLWLGSAGARVLWSLRPDGIARVDSVALDGTVVGFTLVVSAVAVLIFGLAPMGAVLRTEAAQVLRGADGRTVGSRRTAREWVTVGEVAIGIVLLVGTALLGQTVARLARAELGFETGNVLTFKVALPERSFPTDGERTRLATEIDRRISALPGVTAAGATSHVPLGTWANWADAAPPDGIPDDERDVFFADHRSVTAGYLAALGLELVEGRGFRETDDADSSPVVVVDRTMARRAFPDGPAVGKTLHPSRYVGGRFVPTPAVVVGVVEDVRDVSPARPSGGQVYWPFAQSARWELTWAVRTERADPADLLPDIRREVRAVSPDLAVASERSMDELLAGATDEARFVALLGGVLATLALVVAALGLYSVVTYVAIQRMREFGLRMVLGARREQVLNDVLRDGVKLGALGIAVGLATALALTRFLGSLLYGVSPTDPLTLGGVAVFFLTVVVVASLGPAVRATHVDPVTAMRD